MSKEDMEKRLVSLEEDVGDLKELALYSNMQINSEDHNEFGLVVSENGVAFLKDGSDIIFFEESQMFNGGVIYKPVSHFKTSAQVEDREVKQKDKGEKKEKDEIRSSVSKMSKKWDDYWENFGREIGKSINNI